ncbi:hypothetical protein [Paenibacillus sp. WLX2291]|uniref:hypothetical protein n=1 Tax=Paenibacillus sp. WLX2291 TaxID=3296934 RepID=UPI003983E694
MNTKTTPLQNELDQLLRYEKEHGLGYDDFMALVNISKELLPLDSADTNHIESTWMKYRMNNLEQNEYRLSPDAFAGFDEIVGAEHILQCVRNKGVFGTFHYGAYRYVGLELVRMMENLNSRLDVVVDQDSYDSEKELELWNDIRRESDIHYIVSEEQGSGLKLVRILRNRGNILLYLDGNTGSGEDSQPLVCQHLTSSVQMRSGIYRLVSLLKKELCIVIADQPEPGHNRLIAYKPFAVDKTTLQSSADHSYSLFRDSLMKRPDLWRFWYRHHQYVHQWGDTLTDESSFSPNVDWIDEEYGLGVDLRTGQIYETKTN